MDLDDLHRELMKNPEFARRYEISKPYFDIMIEVERTLEMPKKDREKIMDYIEKLELKRVRKHEQT